jgi:hypothetical protein
MSLSTQLCWATGHSGDPPAAPTGLNQRRLPRNPGLTLRIRTFGAQRSLARLVDRRLSTIYRRSDTIETKGKAIHDPPLAGGGDYQCGGGRYLSRSLPRNHRTGPKTAAQGIFRRLPLFCPIFYLLSGVTSGQGLDQPPVLGTDGLPNAERRWIETSKSLLDRGRPHDRQG